MIIKDFLESMCLAVAAGLIAVTWRQVLAYKFPPVKKFFMWGQKFEGKWFYEPVWGCSMCFAGQFALWAYLLLRFKVVIYITFDGLRAFSLLPALVPTSLTYSIVGHLTAICGAIVLSAIFTNKFNRAENGAA